MSRVVFTNSEITARFALQMAEQGRKFGEQLERLRKAAGFEFQKDLVARMHELGDTGLNTNQMSRYENGEGPMPRERRLDTFAKALGVTTTELRGECKDQPAEVPDVMAELADDATEPTATTRELRLLREELVQMRSELTAAIETVRRGQASLLRHQGLDEPPAAEIDK